MACKEKKINKDYVNSIKQNPCMDCKKSFHSCAMDFDHVDANKKFKEIACMIESYNLDRIKEEILKCDLVCAVCHRIRTHNRRNAEQVHLEE